MPLAASGLPLFRRIVLSAVGAGIVAGLVLALVELVAVAPLIQQAERYENAATANAANEADSHDHGGHAGAHGAAATRAPYSVVASVLTAIGYAFLLGALFARLSKVGWKQGLAWGLAGFAVFQLAPALGLPPAPPGAAEADVALRQAWWLGTVCATALGLALCYLAYRRKQPLWAVSGVALVALPHLVGAPQPAGAQSLVPANLARDFALAALLAAALFWLLLGAVQGYLFGKLNRTA